MPGSVTHETDRRDDVRDVFMGFRCRSVGRFGLFRGGSTHCNIINPIDDREEARQLIVGRLADYDAHVIFCPILEL